MLMSGIPLLLLAAASAHSPHDVSYWVTVPPEPTGIRYVASLFRPEGSLLVRSADLQNVETRYLAPQSQPIRSASFQSGSCLALGVEAGGLWVSSDDGDIHAQHPDIPSDATVSVVIPGAAAGGCD